MPVVSKSLTDALKQILQSLQIPFVFPAAVFVFTSLMLYPGRIEVDDSTRTAFAITVTVLISYLLYACNILIIRIVEGYLLEESWFFQWTLRRERKYYERLRENIAKCDDAIRKLALLRHRLYLHDLLTPELDRQVKIIRDKWIDRKRPLQERMELGFPSVRPEPLPTALGNTIAAFEDYPWARYCIDAVHLWPRMLPILEEKKFTPFLQSEKAVFDFLLNIGFVIVGICFELLLLFGLFKSDWRYLLATALLLIVAYLFYLASIMAAQHWGGMVRVAFDLYREDLRRALHLPDLPEESLEKERDLWQAVSEFLVFGNDAGLKGFVYSSPQNEAGKGGKTCAANG